MIGHKLVNSLACNGRYLKDLYTFISEIIQQFTGSLPAGSISILFKTTITLPLQQAPGSKAAKLTVYHLVIALRLSAGIGGEIEHMQKETGPLDMLQEPGAESLTLMRPLYETRDIGDDKALIVAKPYKPRLGTMVVKG